MTDLKMCEKGRATIHSKVIGNDGWSIKSQEFDIDYWVPIEPQPLWANPEYVAELERRNKELFNRVEDLKMRLALTMVPSFVDEIKGEGDAKK